MPKPLRIGNWRLADEAPAKISGWYTIDGFSLRQQGDSALLCSGGDDQVGVVLLGDNLQERFLGVSFLLLFARNSMQIRDSFRPTWKMCIFIAVLMMASLMSMSKVSEFLYFNF